MFSPRRAILFVIAGVLLLGTALYGVATAGRSPFVSPDPILIKMRRSCLTCPNYVVTIQSDGTVIYEGTSNARVRGRHEFTIESWRVDELIGLFVQSDFAEFENTYPSPGTQRMMVTFTIEMQGFSKSVFSEDRYGPALLLEIERKIDDLPGMRSLTGWTY